MKKITEKYLVHILIGLLVLILAVAGAGGYFIYSLTGQITSVKTGLSSSVADLDEKIKNLQKFLCQAFQVVWHTFYISFRLSQLAFEDPYFLKDLRTGEMMLQQAQ
mgnify:CR=1 FL=1